MNHARARPKPNRQAGGLPRLLAEAIGHHQAGRLADAERLYRQILAADPRAADARHLLGVVASQTGREAWAVRLIGEAIALNPAAASYHSNLGNALRGLGRLEDAVAAFRRAIALDPDDAELHNNLGNPLQQLGRLDEAVASFRAALRCNPALVEAHYNLGNALKQQGQLADAVAFYGSALALRPDYGDAWSNMGDALSDLGRLDEAIAAGRRAVALLPESAASHNNLGNALRQNGDRDEAILCYRGALAHDPASPAAHFNLATSLLAQGDFAAGWEAYEWRWQTAQMRDGVRDFRRPLWRGEPADGRTLLIHAEQGFGDTLQFCRYAPLAAALGWRVILEVPRPLLRLLAGLPGIDGLVAAGDPLPGFDLHCPMLSLPLAFGTSLDTVPGSAPYLAADQAAAAAWQARLPGGRPRIGLAWAGNPRAHSPSLAAIDRRRSMALAQLAPLFEVPAVTFVSLQKNATPKSGFPLIDMMDEVGDFADTAALIANLDLVIAVDSAVAHLAAALGKPVWLLDRFDPCWRWLTGRRDSPWYPSLRIYRQMAAGDWGRVVAEAAAELRRFVGPDLHTPDIGA